MNRSRGWCNRASTREGYARGRQRAPSPVAFSCPRQTRLDPTPARWSSHYIANPEERLEQLGIFVPAPFPTLGVYISAKRHGELVFVSGHGPFDLDVLAAAPDGNVTPEVAIGALIQGKVGAEISEEEAIQAARAVAVMMLSSLRAEVDSLDRVTSILKVFGMVNCAPGFVNTAAVIDGCSQLLVDVFGDEVGQHARSAPGVAELPLNVPVVADMVIAVDPA